MSLFEVYKIENIKTKKVYVGSSVYGHTNRFERHKRDLKANRHHSSYLQRSWNKYGADYFIVTCVEQLEVEDLSLLLEREQFYINLYKAYEPKYGFNMCKIAGSCRGRKHSAESKKKMREAKLGTTYSETTKDKQSLAKVKLTKEQVLYFMECHWIHKESIRSIAKRHNKSHEGMRDVIQGKYRYTKEILEEFLKIHGVEQNGK